MVRRGFCSKFLSILLILALMIGMGGVNSFATEDNEMPTVTEDEIVLEDDIVPEDLEKEDPEKDIEKENPDEEDLEEEDIGEDPEEKVLEENNLEGNLAQEVQGLVAPMSNVILLEGNIIEVESADQLKTALDAIPNGGTIKLIKDIKYTQVIKVINKAITFDLGSYTLNVETTDYAGLWVEDGRVDILGTGELNVIGRDTGVTAKNATVTVSNATSTGMVYYESNSGALAYEGGHITITGDVIGTTHGVYATGNTCSITVKGCVMATGSDGYGARTEGGIISVEGYVTATGTNSWGVFCNMGEITIDEHVNGKGWGVVASGISMKPGICHIGGDITSEGKGVVITGDANVTIDGIINALTYIEIINQVKDGSIESRVIPTTKEGYHTYKYKDVDEYSDKYIVWVKATEDEPIDPIAIIGTKEYTTLDEALDKVNTGETIKLLKSIDYDKGIRIDTDKITFDVGSYTLNVVNSSGPGLEVLNGGKVELDGTGDLNITGTTYGVCALKSTTVEITNATATGTGGYGVYAGGGIVTITGDAKATGGNNSMSVPCGAYASGVGSKITIKGGSTAEDYAGYGAYARNHGEILIGSDTIGGACGAYAATGSNICVTGDAKSIGNSNGIGVNSHGGMITIGGNVEGHNYGVSAETRGDYKPSIVIIGNVIGGRYGVRSEGADCTVEVGGQIETTSTSDWESAVLVWNHGKVLAQGNIIAKNGIGVDCISGGEIKVDGTITAKKYIKLGDTSKVIGDFNPTTTKEGYHTYSDDINTVWVKVPVADTEPPTWLGDSKITAFPTATTLPLKWPKARDNVGVDKYLIYTVIYKGEDGNPGTATFIAEVRHDDNNEDNPEFELKNLNPETKYRIRITAVDKSGNINEWSLENEFVTKKAFTVTFDSQGGTLVSNQIITEGETATNPITTRAGFTFSGWFKESECLNPWNFDIDIVTEDIILFAKWIEEEIKLPDIPVITTNLPSAKSITKGETITLTVKSKVHDGGTISYQWYKDDIAVLGAGSESLTIINASYGDSGSYKVIIINTKDGITSFAESTICAIRVKSSGTNDEDTNEDRPAKKDGDKKKKDNKKPEEIINGIIVLDIDEDIFDENTLVPYFTKNRNDIIVKFSAIIDGEMHLIGNSSIDYLLKDNIKYFTDISEHWAKDDINFVTTREFLDGVGNDWFNPNAPMTRAMLVTALGKLWSVDIIEFETSQFIDVESDKYYAPYVEWAAENGIVKGIGNNLFAPDRSITREEIAVIITNFIKFTKLTLNEADNIVPIFADYNIISDWAKESVRTIQNSGIICGKPGNIFDPQGIATRAEAAVILKRLIIEIVKQYI